jgi:hypothetical protein
MPDPLDVIAHSYRSIAKLLPVLVRLQGLTLACMGLVLLTILGLAWQHVQLQREALIQRKEELLFQRVLLQNSQTIAAQVQALARQQPP